MSATEFLPDTAQAIAEDHCDEQTSYAGLPQAGRAVLLASIVIVALCGIVYELIIGSVSSYLLGNSVYQFSITIGFFMFAMGAGSYVSQYIRTRLIEAFIVVEIILAMVGGICSLALFLAFPFSPALYSTVMMGFILTIGFLVGLEIPLLTRILSQSGGMRKSIASVMSLDYVGALVGSVAFPLVLMPSLGLMRASFAIGIANILVALITLVCLRGHILRARSMLVASGMIFLGLIVLIAMGSRLNGFAQQHLYFDDIVWQKQSPYQSLVVTRNWKKGDMRLYIDGHLQFAEEDEHRYHEALVHPVMAPVGARANVLVLGGGDGLAIREILKWDGVERVDLVDIDPAITRFAARFPPMVALNKSSLADARVHVHNRDAFAFIRETPHLYDRVIIDMPDPHDAAISKLYSVEFYTMIRARLRAGGVVVTQASSPFFARGTYWSIGETLAAAFPVAMPYQTTVPSFGLWGFQLAVNGPDVPTLGDVPVKTDYWNDETARAALAFGKDIARPEGTVVNSIFEPKLYQVYLRDMRRRAR